VTPFPSKRIYLSPPSITDSEITSVVSAMRSGWVAPFGPEVDALESELAEVSGRKFSVALSSGTAALHLSLMALGVGSDDEVVVPTLTFGATAFAVVYVGAKPVFLDVERNSLTLDPIVLEEFLEKRARFNSLPAAVITVDLFGRTCDYVKLLEICERFGVPVISDSAEAIGASHGSDPAGSTGICSVFSFNGNKIITTSGGGAIVTDDARMANKVRYWATQSREPVPWYEHEEIGFNYRMSNISAAIGRAQLRRLPEIIEHRRMIRDSYELELGNVDGLNVMGDPPWGRWNGWLTTLRFDPEVWFDAPARVREALEAQNIEARPIWKPMHQQPVFSQALSELTGIADQAFAEGLCLPSGSDMSAKEVKKIAKVIKAELLG
jgi:dTDP-4-amino-4,6-dideoxygalactose transaminase